MAGVEKFCPDYIVVKLFYEINIKRGIAFYSSLSINTNI